ncbi:MAG: hypothetical protein FWG20_01795 [Candidatus Cloacimonetes bacterium]|nr:hypothetical protein [Candidatus Cloacimonadota bacterium]
MKKRDDKRCKFYEQCRHLKETCMAGGDRLCGLGKNPLIKVLSGKVPFEKIVCVSHKNDETYYAREYPVKKVTLKNEIWGAYMSNIVFLWKTLPPSVKADFRLYARIENKYRPKKKGYVNGMNIFIRGIGSQKNNITTHQDIATHLGNSLYEWVERGFLIKRWHIKGLTAQIIPDFGW